MGISTFDETFAVLQTAIVDDSYAPGPQVVTDEGQRNLRVDNLVVTTDDTVDHVLQLFLQVNGLSWPLGSVTVPALAGSLGVPPIDLLVGGLPAGMTGIVLAPTCALGYILDAVPNTGKHIWAVAIGGLV